MERSFVTSLCRGFGIPDRSDEDEMVPPIEEFVEALLVGFGDAADNYRLLIEPGRSIISPTGVLVGGGCSQETVKREKLPCY